MEIIIKKSFEPHYNRAMGKVIRSKREYDYEMKIGGYVTFEEGCRLAEAKQKEKTWKPSEKLISMIQAAKNASKDGMITLGQHPKLVNEMKKMGTKFELPDWCPKHYKEGGYASG